MPKFGVGDKVRLSGLKPDNRNYWHVYEVRGFVDDQVVWRLPSEKYEWRYSTQDREWAEEHYEQVPDDEAHALYEQIWRGDRPR